MGQRHDGDAIAERGPVIIDPLLARALSKPLRARILGELNLRPMSPSQFVAEVGSEITTVAREFRRLRDWGFIELVERRRKGKRRGGAENVFRAVARDFYDTGTWASLPRFVREDRTVNSVDFYFTRIRESIETGNFDAEVDRHFAWYAPALDRQGWNEAGQRLLELHEWINELEVEAAERMRESGETPIPTTIGVARFRSPTPSELSDYRARKRSKE